MGLVIACVVRILHDDCSIRLGENRRDRALKHLAAMIFELKILFLVTQLPCCYKKFQDIQETLKKHIKLDLTKH